MNSKIRFNIRENIISTFKNIQISSKEITAFFFFLDFQLLTNFYSQVQENLICFCSTLAKSLMNILNLHLWCFFLQLESTVY